MAPITPSRFRVAALVAGLTQGLIVLTGAAVRLTQAGLGCENWPACTEDRLVPEWGLHPWIEFGNRLLSFVVVATVAVAVSFAYRRRPRRSDLIRWSWSLVAGVAAQIVLGGVTVLVDLHPALVGAHFLLSIALLWNAVVLWVRASAGGPQATPAVTPPVIWHGRLVVALAVLVLVLGTLVTGTGPNSGDSRAARLALDLTTIARIHGIAVWCLLAAVVVLAIRLNWGAGGAGGAGGTGGARPGVAASRWLVAAVMAQGTIGYTQFAMGVPPALVEVHILGAVVVWVTVVHLYLSFYRRPSLEPTPPEPPAGDESGSESSGQGMTTAAGLVTMET